MAVPKRRKINISQRHTFVGWMLYPRFICLFVGVPVEMHVGTKVNMKTEKEEEEEEEEKEWKEGGGGGTGGDGLTHEWVSRCIKHTCTRRQYRR